MQGFPRQALYLTAVLLLALLTAGDQTWIRAGDGGLILHLQDDHMITQRVAYNHFRTGLPYFNAGEAVAANSSLFWPILLSGLYHVTGYLGAPVLLFGLSVAMAFGAGLAAASILPAAARLPMLFVLALTPSFIRYAGSGWEHVPQMLCVSAAVALILANRTRAFGPDAAAFALAALSFAFRPDSAAIVAGIWGFLAWEHGRRRSVATALISLSMLAVPALYLGLMLHYYSEPVPNTYHLKGPGAARIGAGLAYLANPYLAGPVPLAVLLLGLWVLAARRSLAERWMVAIFALHLAYVAWVGGDIFGNGRFLLVILPPVLALGLLALTTSRWPGPSRPSLAAALAVVFVWVQVPERAAGRLTPNAARGITPLEGNILVNLRLAQMLEPGDGSIGLHYLGTAYYLPQFHIVDFLGKAEPHIARTPPRYGMAGHDKWDNAYALGRYDIAAVPMESQVHDRVTGPQGAGPIVTYYTDLAERLVASGSYAFVRGRALGLPDDSYGAYVRRDLAVKLGSGS